MKSDNNVVAPRRRIQKGPTQNVIDKLTVERSACGEKAQSVVDVSEIMLRCDVNSIFSFKIQKCMHRRFLRFRTI